MPADHSPFYQSIALEIASKYLGYTFINYGNDATSISSPLVESKFFLFKMLSLAGAEYADYRTILDPRDLEKIFSLHRSNFKYNIIFLGSISDTDPSYQLIEESIKKNNFLNFKENQDRCPYLDISGSWEDYQLRKKKKFWYNISRSQRILEERMGKINFEILQSPVEIKSYFKNCINIYKKNWNGLTSSSIYLRKKGEDFLEELVVMLSKSSNSEIAILKQDNIILAFSIGFKFNLVYYFYIFATNKDPSLSKYSVGKIFIKNLLESVFQRKFQKFDFMAGEEPYKLEWTKSSIGRTNFYIVRRSAYNKSKLILLFLLRYILIWFKRNRFFRSIAPSIYRFYRIWF